MQSCMRRTLDKWQLLHTHSFSRGRRGTGGGLVKCTFYHFSTKMRKCLGMLHEKSSANHYGYLRPGFNLELYSTFKQTDPISQSYTQLLVNALSLKDVGS